MLNFAKEILYIIGLSLIFFGFVFIAAEFAFRYYRSLFSEEAKEVEATITALKKFKSDKHEMIRPKAEYIIEDRLVKGQHYVSVFEDKVFFHTGDTVTVQVNPRHPKIFRIRELDELHKRHKANKTLTVLIICGISIAAGIAIISLKINGLI